MPHKKQKNGWFEENAAESEQIIWRSNLYIHKGGAPPGYLGNFDNRIESLLVHICSKYPNKSIKVVFDNK